MLDGLQEIGNLTGIGVTGGDIVLLPVDVGDLVTDIGTEDVVLFDLIQSQMGVVNSNEDNTLLGGGFDDNAEVNLGDWDQTVVVGVVSQV